MKMKFSVFIFLLCFMMTTSREPIHIDEITKNGERKGGPGLPYTSRLNHKRTYFILFSNPDCILSLLGAQTTTSQKLLAAADVGEKLKFFYEIPGANNMRVVRRITDLKMKTFKDQLQLFDEPKKIPRLYRLGEPDTITQIPLNCNLINNMDSFVLHNGPDLTVYHSLSTNEKKRKGAELFAKYITNFEKREGVNTHTSVFDDQKDSSTALETFCAKINEIVQSLLQSRMDSLSMNNVENSEHDQNFKATRKSLFRQLAETMYHEATVFYKHNEFFNSLFSPEAGATSTNLTALNPVFQDAVDTGLFKSKSSSSKDSSSRGRGSSSRGSSSRGASSKGFSSRGSSSRGSSSRVSSSTVPASTDFVAQRNAVEENTMPRQTTNTASTSTPATSFTHGKMGKILPIIFGVPDCTPGLTLIPIDTLKSKCIYLLLDFEINEFFVYLGREATAHQYIMAFLLIEVFLDKRPDVEVTYIAGGNPIPPPFVIYVKTILQKLGI